MAERTEFKPRMTLGSVIMWISFLLPIVPYVFNMYTGAARIYYLFYSAGGLLILGFLIYCWENHRMKKPFPWNILLYVSVMLCAYGVISPVLMSAAHVSSK